MSTLTEMEFPQRRMRRLRSTQAIRDLVAQTRLAPSDFILPLFVREGVGEPQEIESLPGVRQHTQETLIAEVDRAMQAGVNQVILFGIPETKDEQGSGAWDPRGVVQIAISELSNKFGSDLCVMADLCLDEYTSHGHCGALTPEGTVDNDATLKLYEQVAIAQAAAGADVVAPSGMMDGQVGAIRTALDQGGYENLPILAYSAKFASAFYGPFRDAVCVKIAGGGNRKAYQQDWRNSREAMAEIELDIHEGADMVMIKPAMAYQDVICQARSRFDVPIGAYQVSGEYAMIAAAGEKGWVDADAVMAEALHGIKRSGADFILTYAAIEMAERIL